MSNNTYWNHRGKYQDIYDRYSKLVPKEGKASSYSIEVLRCFSNVYYDIYNNGGCNIGHSLEDQADFLRESVEWIKWYSKNHAAIYAILVAENRQSKEELEALADAVITAVHSCRSLGYVENDPRKGNN